MFEIIVIVGSIGIGALLHRRLLVVLGLCGILGLTAFIVSGEIYHEPWKIVLDFAQSIGIGSLAARVAELRQRSKAGNV